MGLITCPDCKSEVSELAEKCPKCGRPMAPVTMEGPEAKKPMGCWAIGCLSIVGLFVLFAIISGLSHKDSTSPASGPSDSQQPAVDSKLLAQAERLISECQSNGVLGDISYSVITRAVVKPAFYAFEFGSKVGVARSLSYAAKAKGYSGAVEFLDAYTNRVVGELNPYTGQLDWKK